MHFVVLALGLAGLAPLVLAYFANRRTSLRDVLVWMGAAWLAWVLHLFAWHAHGSDAFRFWALALTGCSAVAVLGARRPHVGAWNLVIVGLLAVLYLPVLQEWFLGISSLDMVRSVLLPATVLIGVLNYLPTRLAVVAVAVGLAAAAEMLLLLDLGQASADLLRNIGSMILICPWLAWLAWGQRPRALNSFDSMWLRFRDRYGLLWSQRLREQFNSAARNAGWRVELRWGGLRSHEGDLTANVTATLQALLKRFDETPRNEFDL